MKLLAWTAVAALAVGVATLLIAALTWPQWNAALEYHQAIASAKAAGAEVPDPDTYLAAPAGFYTANLAALYVGGAITAVGVLLGALALHARAVRPKVAA